jgi:thioesterase domain-containing protein/acyl carrier protein
MVTAEKGGVGVPRRILFLNAKAGRQKTMTSEAPVIPEDHLRAEMLQIWKTLLESNDLTIDDDFFERGGDSLLAAEMVLQTERRLGISIPDSLLFEASTIRRLADIFSRSPEVQRKPVYRVSGMMGPCPLFFFHGDWTNGGFYLKDFARSLGPEQPLVAVAPHGIKGESIPRSLEDMAAQRLSQILDFQPHGPFRLGGHCVGGMVALETARLLVASGHDVQVVAMIDPVWTGAGQPWPRLEKQAGVDAVEDITTSMPADMTRTPEGKLQILPDMTRTPESERQYTEALERYEPVPLRAPILVFSSIFDGRPWHQISADFVLFELPGGHYDLVTVRSGVFAAHLRDQLNRIAAQLRPAS